MNEQTAKLLDELSAKLQVTSEHLWEVLVTQAFVSSITQLAVFVALLIVAYNYVQYYKSLNEVSDGVMTFSGVLCVMYAFYVVGFLFSLGDVVAGFVNPEYVALQQVMTVLK